MASILKFTSGPDVGQIIQPADKDVGFADFNHRANVACWLQIVKAIG
jgi:hypothetical protein